MNLLYQSQYKYTSLEAKPNSWAMRFLMQWLKRLGNQQWGFSLLRLLVLSGAIALWGGTTSALAAERLTVRLGPLQQSVSITELEQFALTGEIPLPLRPYSAMLTTEVQQALTSSLRLDPNMGDQLVADMINSAAGERLLKALEVAIPDSSPEELKIALTQAAREAGGLSLLGFIRAYPQESLTIDGTSAIALASQMNLPYWQSQALSSILERELTVKESQPIDSEIDPTLPGEQWVRQQTLTFRDYERRRSIPVDLYWSRRTQGPLVIISHGFGADRRFLGYLANHLASHGFTVAALEHPGSNVAWLTRLTEGISYNGKTSDILPATEFIDRPQDVSFLLDQLERLNRYSTILRGKLNTRQVTVIGHSLGGYTALALAGAQLDLAHLREFCSNPNQVGLSVADWLQCTAADLTEEPGDLRDRRVAQVIALNPVIGRLFNEASLSQLTVPTLMLAGTDDSIMPAVSQQLIPFTALSAPKYLLTAIGGTHLSVGDPANLNHALTESLFVRERRGDETESMRQLLRGVTLAFVEQLTPDAEEFRPFLTSAYAQSFSTPTLQLRLSSKIPDNLTNWLKMAALPLEQLVSSTLARQRQAQENATCSSISCAFDELPLVMFILPGNLLLAKGAIARLKLLHQKRSRSRDKVK